MHAYKVVGHVDENRRVTVTLPADFPVGKAAVIVLAGQDEPLERQQRAYLEALFEKLDKSPPSGRSKQEIDRYLEQERDSCE